MKILMIAGALALTSCHRNQGATSGAENDGMDLGLRGLYSVSSLHGSFRAPKGSSHYIITTLEFEDGKFSTRGSMTSSSTESLRGGSSTAQFLWGNKDGANRTALVTKNGASRGESDFWSSLTTTISYGDGSGPEYDGYKILGMGQSDETRAGVADMGFGSDLERALKERMFVGLLVVRFFSSGEEAENFTTSSIFP